MAIIETNSLVKRFGKFTALNEINIDVNEGEVYGFIGPNGAGKSTTIKILLGILKATSGEARLFGRDAWKDAVDIHKKIAYVPGDVNLWPNLTGGEVIDLFARLRGARDKKRTKELLEKFNLDPSKKSRTYSKGNRQKVALVSAFSSDAELFILDEPTSGLDPLMEIVFQECVIEAKNQGKSILLSSHILSEVEKLCDRVGIIRQGEIIETGSLAKLRHLTRTHLIFHTSNVVPGLDSLKGVHELKADGGSISLKADAEELGAILQYISQFGISKLESMPPTLEELFMRHYKAAPKQEGN
ncbi:ABC transporter ATP-binding protein [Bacillus sp. UMB0728]|uniref:ABC transporter ATP-binding protein n=1 Tax=Bacillus sp. UMB0728 TaxID=2066052 RepID=UPI000C77C2C9|nr:ABC transporter ATP-binding protein [Bacillus sp. UMB0728]PLR74710.1 ABC transporter ATP-binding protein [Bacillus sp. UMB0728]